MLSLKTIKILKGLGIGTGVAVAGTTIGVGYHFSDLKNPYTEFFKRPVADGPNALNQAYFAAKEAGSKVIVGTGFTHDSTISTLSGNSSFKEIGFLGVDVTYNGSHPQNVATVNFKTEQSGFLTGIATGMYLNENESFFEKKSKDGTSYLSYAMWGGISSTPVDSYLAGFQQGIQFFNNQIADKNTDKKLQKIYMVIQKKFYANGFAPNDGNPIIDDLIYGQGYLFDADGTTPIVDKNQKPINLEPSAIFPVAGPQTSVTVSKILSENKKIAVIGVDTAMESDYNTTKNFNFPEDQLPKINNKPFASIIPFSAIKDMSNSTQKILNNIFNNEKIELWKKDGIGGFGFSSIGDLKNDGAGISPNGYFPLINAMKKLPNQNIVNQINETNVEASYKKIKEYFTTKHNIDGDKKLNPKVEYSKIKNGVSIPTSKDSFEVVDNKPYVPLAKANWLKNNNNDSVSIVENDSKIFSEFMSKELKNDYSNDKSKFKNDIKIILSTPTSVLFDHSFSEAGYLGIYKFYFDKVEIPLPPNSSK